MLIPLANSYRIIINSLRFSFCLRYGDKAPKSIVARIFSIIWILLGLVIMAIFMANITSALTAVSLQLEPTDLVGVKVGLNISCCCCCCDILLSNSNVSVLKNKEIYIDPFHFSSLLRTR